MNLIIESAAGNPQILLKLKVLRASEMPPLLRGTRSNNEIIGFISRGIYKQDVQSLCFIYTANVFANDTE